MERIVSQIHRSLLKKQKTVAVAESCTGGLVSGLLTDLSGSSRYFTLGIVAYSNKAKKDILKVTSGLLLEKGAVSKEVAVKLARGVRRLAKADYGMGLTGIAGPGGGSKVKPVGTVFIAIDSRKKKICKNFSFSGNRAQIRKKAALESLKMLCALL